MSGTDNAEIAISWWEKGAQKEKDGSMSDAIRFYREALKTHGEVEKLYRHKLFEEYDVQNRLKQLQLNSTKSDNGSAFPEGQFESDAGEEDPEREPCWLLEILSPEVLSRIIHFIVLQSGQSWVNLSLTCSTLNNLCFQEMAPYRTFAHWIYPRQRYEEMSMDLNGVSNVGLWEKDIWGPDYRTMLMERPYIKFHGLYISIINYLRYGANDGASISWTNPIHMVTYYRYFRFYPDGSCLRLLTTDEPSTVVPHFSRDTPHKDSEICNWSLGIHGELGHLTIRRSSTKYRFVEKLLIKNQGTRIHQRLKWLSSVVIDNDGEMAECSMKKEKPFFFSRVKSYVPSSLGC